MHGRDPKFTEEGDRLQEIGGFQFNGITFRLFLCVLIVFVPSILGHLPVMLDGAVVRGIVSGILGIAISFLAAFILAHYY